jgi:hypothetical protein
MPSAAAGIEADTTGIGIPTSGISVRYQTGSVIGIFVLFGIELPALKKPFPRYTLHVHILLVVKGITTARPYCRWWKWIHPAHVILAIGC